MKYYYVISLNSELERFIIEYPPVASAHYIQFYLKEFNKEIFMKFLDNISFISNFDGTTKLRYIRKAQDCITQIKENFKENYFPLSAYEAGFFSISIKRYEYPEEKDFLY